MQTFETTAHVGAERYRSIGQPHQQPTMTLSEQILRSPTGVPECGDARLVDTLETLQQRQYAAEQLAQLFRQFPEQTIGGNYYDLPHTD
jgi:uncharacterized protein (DUF2461 family)